MKNNGAHRIIDLVCIALIAVFTASALSSCEDTCYDGEINNGEEGLDCGGPCVPCDTTNGTCFDGILNQGEEDVDCGGPCNDCITDSTILAPDFICTGNGGSDFQPLGDGSYWIFVLPNNGWFQLEIVGTVTQGNGQNYAHMVTTGAYSANNYYRSEGGAIYEWNANASVEDIFIPANPTTGFVWNTSTTDSVVIDATDATLNSANGCTYTDLLQFTAYNGGSATTRYYKRGLGLVDLPSVSAYLDSAVVY